MQKIKSLYGLRGLAALIVVFQHFIQAFYPALYYGSADQIHFENNIEIYICNSPLNILYQGNLAVCIFFVLSGYVLSYNYFKNKEREIIVSGAVRRYLRLMIPVFFSIIVVYLFMKAEFFYNLQAGDITHSWWLSSFWNFDTDIFDVFNQGLVGTLFGYNADYNIALWTMTYEMLGSLLVFAILSLIGNMQKRYLFYLIIAVILRNSYYLCFILGLILSDLNINKNYFFEVNNKLIKIAILAMGLFLGSYPADFLVLYPVGPIIDGNIYESFSMINSIIFNPHILGAFFIVYTILISESLKSLLSKKVFVFLGDISFSMYLIHVIIIGSFSSSMIIMLKNLNYNVAFILVLFSSLIVIISLSYLMYKYIDLKSINFSKLIYKKYLKEVSENNN